MSAGAGSSPSRLLSIAATALLPWVAAWAPAGQWWLPLALVGVVYPEFARRVRAGEVMGAWRWGMAWAAVLSVSILVLVACQP